MKVAGILILYAQDDVGAFRLPTQLGSGSICAPAADFRIRCLQICDISTFMTVTSGRTQRQIFTQRNIDHSVDPAVFYVSKLPTGPAFKFIRWISRIDNDHTPGRIAAIERALRAAKDLDIA